MIESFLKLFPVPLKSQKIQIIGPKPQKVFPCAFFDGAAAEKIGGAGYVIYLNDNHFLVSLWAVDVALILERNYWRSRLS